MSPEAPRASEIKPLTDSQYEANSGFLDEVFGSRKEQTIAGCVIGTVRGIFSEPDSAQGQAERAQSNDQIAMIAADTIASIPKLKAVTGGVVRASLLVNPHESMSDNSLSFGTNALEGAALNKVSRLAMPESAFAKSLSVRLGTGLAAETASHLTVGFGFGAVKTTFNPDTWRGGMTAKGLADGAGDILKGGTVGALINVPAGMIGVRSAKGASALLSKDMVSPHVANMIAGAGSGYASGSVFGGVDAVMHGKKWPEVLTQMHQSGLIGAGTGGLMSSIIGTPKENHPLRLKNSVPSPFENTSMSAVGSSMRSITLGVGRNSNRLVFAGDDASLSAAKNLKLLGGLEESIPSDSRRKGYQPDDVSDKKYREGEHKELLRKRQEARRSKDQDEGADLTPEERNDIIDNKWFDRVSYQPKEEPPDLAALGARLGKPSEGFQTFVQMNDHAPKTFANREQFWEHMMVSDRPVRVYEVKGHSTKIIVEEQFAQELDLIRLQRMSSDKFREKASEPCAYDDLPKEQRQLVQASIENGTGEVARNILGANADHSIEIVKARLIFLRPAEPNRMLPEEFIPILDELPNPGLIKQLTLVKERNHEDAWLRQTYDREFVSVATASTLGEVKFYNPTRSNVREYMLHEWSHLVKFGQKDTSRLFDLAMLVDKEEMNITHPPRGEDGKHPPGELEKGMYFASRYSRRNEDENFAVHMGEYFLNPDADEFMVLARSAPVRATVFGRALNHELNTSGRQTPFAEQLRQRIKYVEENIVPDAQKVLVDYLWHTDANKRAAAADLLGHFGDQSHVSPLRDVATKWTNKTASSVLTTDLKLPTSMSSPKVEGVQKTVSEAAFDAMVLLQSDQGNRLHTLMKHAQPGSPVKDLAIARMRSMGDSAAHSYANFYQLAGNPDNLPRIVDMIPKMPTKEGALIAFHEALRLGRGVNADGFEMSLALRLLDKRTDLNYEALQLLARHAPDLDPRAIAKITRYTTSTDKTVAETANKVILLHKNSRGPSYDGAVPEATWILFRQHSFDAIPTLLQSAVNHGNVEAYSALNSYARPVIRHFSRELRDLTPARQSRLEALLKGSKFPG